MLLEKYHENHQINILWLQNHILFKGQFDKNFQKSVNFHVFENIKPNKFFLVMLEMLKVARYGSLHCRGMKKSNFTKIYKCYSCYLAGFSSTTEKCEKIIENVKKKQHFLFSALFKKVKHTKCAQWC